MNNQPPPPGVHNGREQAFATAPCIFPNGNFEHGSPGLSKREYFAAAVLQGLCTPTSNGTWRLADANNLAETAVGMADALLAELEKAR